MVFKLQPSSFLCMVGMIVGIIISLSSNNWISAWIGLELNLVSFLPLIMGLSEQNSEGALKYFLIQAMASQLLIFACFFNMMNLLFSNVMISFALLLKLGAAPFHIWYPAVAQKINWFLNIILMTVQKIVPLYLSVLSIMNLNFWFSYLMVVSLINSLVGGLSGINQLNLRKLMAFSSINHLGWILASSAVSSPLSIKYFFIYSVMSISVILNFMKTQSYNFNKLMNSSDFSARVASSINLLSMGGLPPFLGFIPKWFVVQELASLSLFTPILMTVQTLVTLFFYIRLTWSLISGNPKSFNINWTLNKSKPLWLLINCLGTLGSCSLFMI